jgi:hypothetical protein
LSIVIRTYTNLFFGINSIACLIENTERETKVINTFTTFMIFIPFISGEMRCVGSERSHVFVAIRAFCHFFLINIFEGLHFSLDAKGMTHALHHLSTFLCLSLYLGQLPGKSLICKETYNWHNTNTRRHLLMHG